MRQNRDLKIRYQKEAASFDSIAQERKRHNHIPDMRASFENTYFYNNIWRNSIFFREEYGPLCAWIIRSLKSSKVHSVVEVGCGTGWLSLELARHGFEVTGIDLSGQSIEIAQAYYASRKEKGLRLHYRCQNIEDYAEYAGKAVVSFGFLHHLPPKVLRNLCGLLTKKGSGVKMLLAVEPRYDHASIEMATFIYALRLAFPNHFAYSGKNRNVRKDIAGIFEELTETRRTQSEMDNESPSDTIIATVRKYFPKVELGYSTAFFDKFIGSARISGEDTSELSDLLKQLDNMIVKYNADFSRNVMIKAVYQ